MQNNGGPTQTIALVPGSPALNAGDPAVTAPGGTDQRGPGFVRVAGGRLDIGAYEVQDVAAPGAPDLQAASDSGASSTDNQTTNTAPTFDIGGVLAGAKLQLLRDGVVVATLNNATAGTHALQDPGPVGDGTYNYTARQTLPTGDFSPLSGALSVTVDTSVPSKPGVPDLQAASDSGVSSTDNQTTNTAPTFDIGGIESGATVQLLRDGVVVKTLNDATRPPSPSKTPAH